MKAQQLEDICITLIGLLDKLFMQRRAFVLRIFLKQYFTLRDKTEIENQREREMVDV